MMATLSACSMAKAATVHILASTIRTLGSSFCKCCIIWLPTSWRKYRDIPQKQRGSHHQLVLKDYVIQGSHGPTLRVSNYSTIMAILHIKYLFYGRSLACFQNAFGSVFKIIGLFPQWLWKFCTMILKRPSMNVKLPSMNSQEPHNNFEFTLNEFKVTLYGYWVFSLWLWPQANMIEKKSM